MSRHMQEKVVSLVTGSACWWKQRKDRREAASVLKQLRQNSWRWGSMKRLPAYGVDTRCFKVSCLQRPASGGN
jgi:hypothetical protein